MIKKLAGSIREFKRPTVLTLLMITGEAVIETIIPFMTANLVNHIKAGSELSYVIKIGIILVAMALISLVFGWGAGMTSAKASAGFARNLRHDIFCRVQGYSFENIDKFSTSSLVTRMTTDINNVQMAYMMCIRMAVRCPLMMIFSSVMAFVMGGSLALAFVLIIPFMAFGLYLVAKNAMPAFRSVFRKYDALNESIEENVQAMRVVKGFAREDYEKKKFDIAARDICGDFTKAERIVAINMPLMSLCMYFNMVVVLLIGSRIAITGMGTSLDVGQISAMITYGVQILMSLMMISFVYVILTMSAESGRRICEALDEESTIRNPEAPVMHVKDGAIDFENVSFRYSRAQGDAVRNIDLHIRSGMTVGILGGTGSGKTTLVSLIPRLYDVTSGVVKVGGTDVRKYDLEILRDQVAVVLQKNLLFAGTIKDNLRWGNAEATDEEIVSACRLAQVEEFIGAFPDGYDTWVEQGGTNVSGGQKQRLCIARALLKKPRVLILDDSTSAVDTQTDALIREGFRNFIPETTKLIIAQRISSVQDADMIIVLNDGAISGMGTHEELLANNEIYRDIYQQQMGGKENE